MTTLLDLPIDIILIIVQFLPEARDLLSFCASHPSLHNSEQLQYNPSFWSHVTTDTFRVANRPVVAGDGRRWRNLYRGLIRDTKVYVWGNNDRGSLGKPGQIRFARPARGRVHRLPPRQYGNAPSAQANAAWPQELTVPDDIGVIADLQCGGWSTAVLGANGKIHVTGMLKDALGMGGPTSHLCELLLPFGYDDDRVRQFSLGRAHLLAIGDEGQAYYWDDVERRGSPLDFPTITPSSPVTKVVAGWGHSSCYIPGTGIAVWEPMPTRFSDLPADALHTMQPWIVPHTAQRPTPNLRKKRRENLSTPAEEGAYGGVVNWIVLSAFVVWLTETGRTFTTNIPGNRQDPIETPLEITRYALSSTADNSPAEVLDIQGTHEKFALLAANGEVLISSQAFLSHIWQIERRGIPATPRSEITAFTKPSALQNTGVIQLAFGDWHYHALHADGSISSWGKEPQFCGALGLGGDGIDAVRGIKSTGFGGDGELLPQCESYGRRVQFETEKAEWMNYVRTGGSDKREAEERMNLMYEDDGIRAAVSEWFEERLKGWERRVDDARAAAEVIEDQRAENTISTEKVKQPSTAAQDHNTSNEGKDELPSYFALTIAAAGWHSGALILHNEDKAARTRAFYRDPPPLEDSRVAAKEGQEEGQSTPTASSPSSLQYRWSFSISVEHLTSTLNNLGRSFLGLPLADTNSTQEREEESGPGYRWEREGETFPRLRLKDEELMPGEVEVDEWRCPEWKQAEEVMVVGDVNGRLDVRRVWRGDGDEEGGGVG